MTGAVGGRGRGGGRSPLRRAVRSCAVSMRSCTNADTTSTSNSVAEVVDGDKTPNSTKLRINAGCAK